jgi:hypothetical protein
MNESTKKGKKKAKAIVKDLDVSKVQGGTEEDPKGGTRIQDPPRPPGTPMPTLPNR